MEKIVGHSDIRKLVDSLRADGKSIVTMNGSFDVLHAGHVRCLQEAAEQGDVLIVPLNSDLSIKGYKGQERPIIPQEDRAEMLAALSCVDHVVIFDEPTPKALLSEICPDVHCNGADWGPACIERETVERGGGRIHILQWSPGKSTSQILKKIRSETASPAAVIISKKFFSEGTDGLRAAADCLRQVSASDTRLVIFSEEPAVAGGEMTADDVEAANASLRDELEQSGVTIDATYFCPHNADGPPKCSCRPPLTGLLERARDDLGLSLGSSWVVSDDMRHILMGREINTKTIFLGQAPEGSVMPHHEAKDMAEVISTVLGV